MASHAKRILPAELHPPPIPSSPIPALGPYFEIVVVLVVSTTGTRYRVEGCPPSLGPQLETKYLCAVLTEQPPVDNVMAHRKRIADGMVVSYLFRLV